MRIFLHILVMLAVVLSTVSPACAFISGKTNMIEICGADGSLKRIAVSEALDPKALLDEQQPAPHAEKPPCAFCIALAGMKAVPPVREAVPVLPLQAAYLVTGPGSIILSEVPELGFTPTGPPLGLSHL